MCGIAGIVGSLDGIDTAALRAALRHRGPDSEGEREPQADVWLCAARLAMVDLSPHGAQPMTRGDCTLVYNGELYNTDVLASELGDGDRRGRSDTEILLASYQRWGPSVVQRLEGMFAFALWDGGRGHLLLARDPLGVKPLWVARQRGRLAFSSEVRALIAGRIVEPRLDPAAIDLYLSTGSVAEHAGLLADVAALEPGTYELWRPGTSTRVRYFSLPEASAAPMGSNEVRAEVTAIRDRLTEVVPRVFAADAQVGLLLSEGLDSAALALLASGRTTSQVHSFHVALDAAGARAAASRARRLGFAHHEVSCDGDILGRITHWMEAQDLPSIDGLNTFVVCGAIRAAGVKAAVSGLGGDELFLGYPSYFSAERWRRVGSWRGPLLRLGAERLSSWGPRAMLATGLSPAGWRACKGLDTLSSEGPVSGGMRVLFPRSWRRALGAAPSPMRPTGHDDEGAVAAARRDLRGYLVETLLRDADNMSMAHGVELRVPLLDVRLVERIARLPDQLRLSFGRKGLLLAAFRELEPERSVSKVGFELPVERIGEGATGAWLRALMHSRDTTRRCGLDVAVTGRLFDTFARTPSRPTAFRVLAVGALLAWARRNGASL